MNFNRTTIAKRLNHRVFKPFYLLLVLVLLCSHNLYIKLESYFLEPNQDAILSLYNGTFENSENIISRDRILDASIIAQGKRVAINAEQWKDQDSTITQLLFNTGEAGTYVAGVSTKARTIELSAEKFNSYLEHDGVLDMLARRVENNLLDKDAIESYQKHVKAIYQVGEVKTSDWNTVLGYPIEFVPQENPYDKYTGDRLKVQLLLDGKPLAQQLVYADYIPVEHNHDHDHHGNEHDHDGEKKYSHDHEHDDGKHSHDHDDKAHSHKHDATDYEHNHDHDKKEHSHEHDDAHNHDNRSHDHKHDDGEHSHDHDGKAHSHKHGNDDAHTQDHEHNHVNHSHDEKEHTHNHSNAQQLLTNDQGIVEVDLPEDGIYYIRTIHMVSVTDNDELTHRSKWATLTFEVTHKHDDSTHSHDHEDGIPTWIFIVGSVLIVGVLFLVFRKKS
ncbi:DUF4198 domain-containing protein [Winogradskyella sp.]|uniref:DUF4198 domain-containing protein n=1 Tax=Winogradskyella sp. TaxID=1883156 RepID=UPI0026205D52|nr:DUF4198 domain-containing protein [Winogradskyella sp.]